MPVDPAPRPDAQAASADLERALAALPATDAHRRAGCMTSRATSTTKSRVCWDARPVSRNRSSRARTCACESCLIRPPKLQARVCHACRYPPVAEPARRRSPSTQTFAHHAALRVPALPNSRACRRVQQVCSRCRRSIRRRWRGSRSRRRLHAQVPPQPRRIPLAVAAALAVGHREWTVVARTRFRARRSHGRSQPATGSAGGGCDGAARTS